MRKPEAASSRLVRFLRPSVHRLLACLLLACLFAATAGVSGCKRKAQASPETALEAPVVKDATEGLQLTWIDDKGEFHIEQRVADVPAASREMVRVRVLDPVSEAPSGDRVFVADLRNAGPDGAYSVRAVPRAEFEDVAVTRRSKNGTAVLAPKGAASGAGVALGGAAAGAGGGATNGAGAANGGGTGDVARPAVVIYGASWCGPCHQAEAYLKKKGVPYVEYDIEQDSSKAREMQSKLAKAGMRGGSIPVLDVRGRILVGFDPRAVDAALGTAL
jgi:glutaredoxin